MSFRSAKPVLDASHVAGRGWRIEFLRIAVVLVLGLAIGYAVGAVMPCLLVAMTGLLAWHLLHLYRIEQWLNHRRGYPESLDRSGPWRRVYSVLHGLQFRNRKRKKRVRKLLARFQSAASASPDGAVITGLDGDIIWASPAAATMLGLRLPGDKRRPIANFIRDPDFTTYMSRGNFEEPLEIRSPVDRAVMLSIRIVPYGNDRSLLLARDITRMKLLERMHKDFVANVSHELRSPLTVINGYLEWMEDEPDVPEAWRKPIEQMSQQSERMCAIVEDLLKLSRLESNPQAAPMNQVNVLDMLRSVAGDALNLSAGRHEIQVQGDEHVRLLGDYNELYSAASNLVFNAVQYTAEGGEVELLWRTDEQGGHLDVVDTGLGIEAHHIPRLTERFYRADKARSREFGGTGLGLAIVKHVLARHEATLEITSVVGEGSTFSCRFPAHRIAEFRAGEQAPAEAEDATDADGEVEVEAPRPAEVSDSC